MRKQSYTNLILIILLFLSHGITIGLYAQNNKPTVTADLYGGIYLNNEQAWQIEPSISWTFHKYFGIGLGLELTSQYNQPSR